MLPSAPSARRRSRLPVWLAVVGLALAGCQVSIEDKSGVDPCSPNPCASKGVCGGWTGVCKNDKGKAVCSGWKWTDKKSPAPKDATGKTLTLPGGYEGAESKCDGLDNDCDGLTDETTSAKATDACPAQGVCTGMTPKAFSCVQGAWKCDFGGVDPAWEASETTCDGKDNDCDGQTDENPVAKATDCKRQGVCTGLPAPVCAEGKWDCGYAQAADFEEAESKCDGKDNDCDGIADANLSGVALPAGQSCASQGVCKTVSIVCQGGVATCAYGQIQGWEALEKTCDGADNDCDGQTDNLAGTSLPLQATDTTGCKNLGVCAAGKTAVVKLCQNGQFQCVHSAVPGFEDKESSCDGKDNDCDGATDNGLTAPNPSPCGNKGVCSGGPTVCAAPLWKCDFDAMGKQGYEAFELTCDGKDNDCDGTTDEGPNPAANGCTTTGVCAFGTAVTCASGKPTCDYSHVKAYEAVTETTCDGQDNDCDGKTDEPEGLDGSKAPCSQGVCAGKAKLSCDGGAWKCDLAGVTDYEASEKSCDGKDNDCDGQTDEGLSAPTTCLSAGVCSKDVVAACVGGKFICSYAAVQGYEAKESSCDGADNDCDGKTDTGVCAAGSTCSSDGQCASGVCTAVLGGSGKVCTAKAGQCAQVSGGQVQLVDDGASACASGSAVQTCTQGTWSSATTCGSQTPVCVAGSCVLCIANAVSCDPGDKTKIVKCAADGKSVQTSGTCEAGTHCVGSGACAPDDQFTLSDAPGVGSMATTGLSDGSVVVAWQNESPLEIRVRLLGADGKPKGASAAVHGNMAPSKGHRLAIAPVGSGFAVAWVTSGDGPDIAVRFFSASALPLAGAAIVHPNNASETQKDPALAGNANGLVVAWTGDETDGVGAGIGLQRFDAKGVPVGDLTIVNDDPNATDDPIFGEQFQPTVTMRPTGEFAVAWTHGALQTSKDRIRGRLFGADGKPLSGVVALSAASKQQGHNMPTLVFAKSLYVLAWRSEGIDPSGYGIAVQQFDDKLKALGTPQVANTITAGDQDEPRLAAHADGTVTLTWKSPAAISAQDGSEVSSRDLGPTGTLLGSEVVLTQGKSAGDQDLPRVLAFPDGRVLFVWRHRADASAPGDVVGKFR